MLIEHMHKKFEINRAKIKGGCQSGSKVVTHNSKSDLLLVLHSKFSKKITGGPGYDKSGIVTIYDQQSS